jgi:hypothetical protein
MKYKETWVGAYAPHDILYAIASCKEDQVKASISGDMTSDDMIEFWTHCKTLDEYRNHPSLQVEDHLLGNLYPISIHVDGAEVFTNTEYIYYSISCMFGTGDIYDRKIPVIAVRKCLVQDLKLLDKQIAQFFANSLEVCERGIMPSKCIFGKNFPPGSVRAKSSGRTIPKSVRACYFNFKFDQKERVNINRFKQNWRCTLLCDSCCAQKPTAKGDPAMFFTNFSADAPYGWTIVTSEMHQKFFEPSPYSGIRGWHLSSPQLFIQFVRWPRRSLSSLSAL